MLPKFGNNLSCWHRLVSFSQSHIILWIWCCFKLVWTKLLSLHSSCWHEILAFCRCHAILQWSHLTWTGASYLFYCTDFLTMVHLMKGSYGVFSKVMYLKMMRSSATFKLVWSLLASLRNYVFKIWIPLPLLRGSYDVVQSQVILMWWRHKYSSE